MAILLTGQSASVVELVNHELHGPMRNLSAAPVYQEDPNAVQCALALDSDAHLWAVVELEGRKFALSVPVLVGRAIAVLERSVQPEGRALA